jgi:hypothetical protein
MSHYSTSTVILKHGTSVPNILVKEHRSPKDHASRFQSNSWNLNAQSKAMKYCKVKDMSLILKQGLDETGACLPQTQILN